MSFVYYHVSGRLAQWYCTVLLVVGIWVQFQPLTGSLGFMFDGCFDHHLIAVFPPVYKVPSSAGVW